jgi:hypothetical protein
VVDCGSAFSDKNGGHRLNELTPRPIIGAITEKFAGTGGPNAAQKSCDQLAPCWRCAQTYAATSPDMIAKGACDVVCGLSFGDGSFNFTDSSGAFGSSGGSSTGPEDIPYVRCIRGVQDGRKCSSAWRQHQGLSLAAALLGALVTLVAARLG